MTWTWAKILVLSLSLLFYGLVLLHKIELPIGDDLPRLIQNGRVLFSDTDVLTKNLYSYTEPQQPFANHHWLSSVVFFWLYQVIGYGGLVILKVILGLVTFAVLFFATLKRANFWVVAWLSIPTILMLSARTQVRPEIFSYLLIAIFIYLLFSAEDKPRQNSIYLLIPLQILWVNSHLFFGIGVLMTAGFLVEKIIQSPGSLRTDPLMRKLAIITPLLALACLVSPYGIQGALFSLRLNVFREFPILIAENQSIPTWLSNSSLTADLVIPIFFLSGIIAGLSLFCAWRRRPVFFLAGLTASFLLAYKLIRALPFFSFMFLPSVSANLSPVFEGQSAKLRDKYPAVWIGLGRLGIFTLCLFWIILVALRFSGVIIPRTLLGAGLTERSLDAAQFFIEQDLHGPVFNDPDIGSYLIFYLYPQERVFIDNRFGDAYSIDFTEKTYLPMIQDEEIWRVKQAEYQFNTLFFYAYDQAPGLRDFLYRRANDPEWVIVHVDVYNIIFVRNIPANQKVIEMYGVNYDNAGERLGYLTEFGDKADLILAADTFNLLGRADLSIQTYLRVVTEWPEIGKIWSILGEWELSFDDGRSPILAMMYLERAIENGQRNGSNYLFLASAYIRMGLYDKAEEAIDAAKRLQPDRPEIQEYLDTVAERRQLEPIPDYVRR
ncbi:MAG: tetratricopeptide repeat protein [Patescibacteria group bacterium]